LDLFSDIGVVKIDPRDHAVTPLPSATRAESWSASPSP
jgi:hypothetical protein